MATSELSNIDIVIYALYKLRGVERKVHTEEVAFEAYKLAKERFGWRLQKFRAMDFPDKEIARIALMDAAKEKNGGLAEGRSGVEARGKETDGWVLTPAGATWVRRNLSRIERGLGVVGPDMSKANAERFRKQITKQPLFQAFMRNNSVKGESPYVLSDMLNTSPDAPREVIATKFSRLSACAKINSDLSSAVECNSTLAK